jgi:hypothetical protein
MTLAVRMVAWLVAKVRMIQPAVEETVHSMRTIRRPQRSISRPLKKIPNALATPWTLAAMKDKQGYLSGFGGLVVSMLSSGTQVRGFKPSRSCQIFRGEKILSLPSFGGEVKQICGMSKNPKITVEVAIVG